MAQAQSFFLLQNTAKMEEDPVVEEDTNVVEEDTFVVEEDTIVVEEDMIVVEEDMTKGVMEAEILTAVIPMIKISETAVDLNIKTLILIDQEVEALTTTGDSEESLRSKQYLPNTTKTGNFTVDHETNDLKLIYGLFILGTNHFISNNLQAQ